MANMAVDVLLWVVLLGYATFCTLYALWAKPWKDRMGRHILAFMSGLAWAFIYAVVSQYIEEKWRVRGWVVVLFMLAFLVWWRVAILVKYKLEGTNMQRESDVK